MLLRPISPSLAPCGPGDTFHMPPGHDAWIVGGEKCVLLDFGGLKGYATAS